MLTTVENKFCVGILMTRSVLFPDEHSPFKMADNQDKNNLLPRDFSKVVLTLENVLLPEEKLSATSSLLDGLDKDTEWDLRILGCELIQTSGILLKLPQVNFLCDISFTVTFQRFFTCDQLAGISLIF